MVSSELHLKTQQVARALGVSGATVKRWVDAGIIQAARTAGKHRLVPISEVRRMASELGTRVPSDGVRSELDESALQNINESVVDRLTGFLRAGDATAARALIRTVSRACRNGGELADRLISPVMERIGHGWMVGSLDVYQEHLASSIVAAAIQERIDELEIEKPAEAPRQRALGATTEGDFYILPGLLAELILREQGWDARNLGTNLPLRSLANAARELQPRLIFISINYLKDEDRFIREYFAFYQAIANLDAAVILGGRALRPELRAQLPYTAFGDRMSHLAEFARRFTPRETTSAPSPPDSSSDGHEASRSPEHHE
jgi:excisionase family DNA binding protein